MNADKTMHVIFGTGALGRSVMRALLKRGARVRMVNRSGTANVPAGVEVAAADAYDAGQTRAVTEDAAVVYQCAAPRYSEWVDRFPALQGSIMNGAMANGAKFIVGENVYMYGAVAGPIHEALPYSAHTRKGQVRGQMACDVLAAHQRGDVRAALVRGSDFFGPHVGLSALGESVFRPALAGKAAQAIGDVDQPHSYTFIDDFGEALVTVAAHDDALGQAWHVPNTPAKTTREIIGMIYAETGHPPKISAVSKWMLRLAGLFSPDAGEMVEMFYEFDRPFIVDGGKFETRFGVSATPLSESIAQTVAWYRAN